MHLRLWRSLPAGLVLLIALPGAVCYASVGVGIQAGPVRLHGLAHPGGSYALPPVYVVNTGSETESVTVRIERLQAGAGLPVPASWITVSDSGLQLARNQSARIPLQLSVPATARSGSYRSDVIVKGSATLSAGQANLGVAAATDLRFTVGAGAIAKPWLSLAGWLLAIAIGLALVAVIVLAYQRLSAAGRRDRTLGGQPSNGGL